MADAGSRKPVRIVEVCADSVRGFPDALPRKPRFGQGPKHERLDDRNERQRGVAVSVRRHGVDDGVLAPGTQRR